MADREWRRMMILYAAAPTEWTTFFNLTEIALVLSEQPKNQYAWLDALHDLIEEGFLEIGRPDEKTKLFRKAYGRA